MSEEHLRMLEALGTLAREEHHELEQLQALSDPAQRAQALANAPEHSSRLLHATEPLSAESQARIAQRVQDALRARGPAQLEQALKPQAALQNAEPPANENAVLPVTKKKRPSARAQRQPVQPRASATQWTGVFLPLLAAAAATLLLWREPAHSPAGLPEYSLQASASAEYRGDPSAAEAERLVVPPHSVLKLELRPESEYGGLVELRVQVQRAGEDRDWPARVERSPHGALRVSLERSDVPAHGSAQLLVTLARPDALPLLAAREPGELRGDGWQAWLVDVELP